MFYRDIFPEGLPPSYVFVATIRLQAPETQEVVDLWRILSKAGEVQAAVTLDGTDSSVIFTVTQMNKNDQVIKFKDSKLKVKSRLCYIKEVTELKSGTTTFIAYAWTLFLLSLVIGTPFISMTTHILT